MIIPIEIQNEISKYMYNIIDVINMHNQSKNHQIEIRIINLYSANEKDSHKLSFKLTQNIIEQKKFRNIEKLNVCHNSKIINVNHIKETLKVLKCGYNCGIDQAGIFELKLTKFDATNNSKIKNINHMKETLKILICNSKCGIDQYGISKLNLRELDASHNEKIFNVNHMKETLKILCCMWNCGIDQDGISQLNLQNLISEYNNKI